MAQFRENHQQCINWNRSRMCAGRDVKKAAHAQCARQAINWAQSFLRARGAAGAKRIKILPPAAGAISAGRPPLSTIFHLSR